MTTPTRAAPWHRNRFVWVALILLSVSAAAVALVHTAGSGASQATDLNGQLTRRIQVILEQTDPTQHQGHGAHIHQGDSQPAKVVCAARVYGFEPTSATTVAEVNLVYGYHLCGLAEQNRPWDWAVKLVGPVIIGIATDPPTVTVAESTETVTFTERVRQLFPERYQQEALQEAIGSDAMTELRRRYEVAAGL